MGGDQDFTRSPGEVERSQAYITSTVDFAGGIKQPATQEEGREDVQ